ncbi:MAG: flagellar hook capping protein [Oscillibacter sp.]|jgi:flagellar basal-body rod modification protein FlgD|nr:flagellar hook capping protein [Oscillibacter sp.]MCI9001204.1 flagellar hook capping protein [Oscillibacter sp.]
MSDFMQDVGNIYGDHKVGDYTINVSKKGSNMDLDMTDFITLMITQMTNQGIDDTMDTSEMLNQMVQMQMIQSMVNMTDATTMNYAASLVGKEVTVGKYNGTELEELVGTVTATGTKDGQHIIFINDEYYYLNEIMAVGRLPKPKDEEDGEGDGEGEDGTGDVTQKPDDTQKPDGDQKPDGVNPGGGTEGSNNGTGDGTTQDTNG